MIFCCHFLYACIDLNFELQNHSDEEVTIKTKVNHNDHDSNAGFDPPSEQTATSNGGKAEFTVTN